MQQHPSEGLPTSLVVSLCRELLALNVYLAMCYHRLDYYDVSQEVLASYVQTHADSTIAINLKACNYYRLFNGKAAEVSAQPPCSTHVNQHPPPPRLS